MRNQIALIAIITYKRPYFLNRCIASLSQQTIKTIPPILIVDNDPDKSAHPIYQKWQYQLPLSYVVEKKRGAPCARNKALKYCKTGWLAFIDDDAIADTQWVSAIKSVLSKLPTRHQIGFIIGETLLANPSNLCAQAQYLLHRSWFKKKVLHYKAGAETLDTKNCLLNCHVIHQYHLSFDNSFVTDGISGHEDTDLGKLLEIKGYQGLYCPKMHVFHQEKSLSTGLLKKAYLRGVLRYRFDRKWKLRDHWIENAPDFRLYLPPYRQNAKRWKHYLRWIIKGHIQHKKGKQLLIALIQELFLSFFNQGYLDERRKFEILHQ